MIAMVGLTIHRPLCQALCLVSGSENDGGVASMP